MGNKQRNISGSDKAKALVAILLLALIIIGDLVSAFVGMASPAPYTMNFAIINTRGPVTSVHNLFGVNQTNYCTGVTTLGLTLRSSTPRIQLSFLYKINDQNVTGQIINVVPEITTNSSLQTTFGVGACDRCNGSNTPCPTNLFQAYTAGQQQYFPVLNVYFATTGIQNGPLSGPLGPSGSTVFAYLDIVAQTTDVKIAVSSNTQAPSISMIELV